MPQLRSPPSSPGQLDVSAASAHIWAVEIKHASVKRHRSEVKTHRWKVPGSVSVSVCQRVIQLSAAGGDDSHSPVSGSSVFGGSGSVSPALIQQQALNLSPVPRFLRFPSPEVIEQSVGGGEGLSFPAL
ncbi:unnamed protein product [Pleuronectes platessa]|uniref:Uncharacterized protein n=1 Tax=Pleuronectes platessa TaxID=8262 RepID=A0A9N7U3H4_PLEPL|nr:unnamed protein product [Pleuronectes platessa]